jgi:glycosyltransferase involved in cell wall biosynthesis
MHGGEFKIFYQNSGVFQFLIRYILNTTDVLVCLSDEWKTYFDSITKFRKSIILNNPVILPLTASENKISLPIKILFLNHITTKKGIFDLVEVFIKNEPSLKNIFELAVAGAGDSLEELQRILTQDDFKDFIEYKGWVNGTAKTELLQNCNLFVLISYNEGLPMSILESMSFGKPVIATRVGGIPRIVRPGENGWLIEPGDIIALQWVFEQIKANPSILETYGKNSFRIVQDYSPDKVNDKLNEIYAELLHTAIPQPKTTI